MKEFVAVFIDWENIEKTVQNEYGSILDFETFILVVRDKAMAFGDISGIFAYGDFDRGNAGLQTKLIQLGVQPKHVVTKTAHEYLKGSTDIELSLDILETMYMYNHITNFILVSGDGDLLHAARRLKLNGKSIHFMGFKKRTNKNLLDFSTTFINLEEFPEVMRKITQNERDKLRTAALNNDMVRTVLEKLDYEERYSDKPFIGLNLFRRKLIDKYPEVTASEALTKCLEADLIKTYQVDNPKDANNPTTACMLNRELYVISKNHY